MSFTAYILDVLTDSIYPARITIENGLFKQIIPISSDDVDVEGLMIPGFIDSHIHIESSMLTPAQFAKLALRHGTTSVVCDPHEIANVCGVEGIDFMIDNGSNVPFNFYFTAPSCVPTTQFETSGASIDSEDIHKLLERDEIVGLAEMMNFPGVLASDDEVLAKINASKKHQKPVDGHAPLLSGEDLRKYVSEGICSDHECSDFDEAIEKKKNGMKIMVRDGSSAKNMEAIFDFTKRLEYWRNQDNFGIIPTEVLERRIHLPIFDFIVSDDKHPEDLIKGHLNESIKKAVDMEVDIIKAIEMVTINPATHFKLNTGIIATGMQADYVIIDNLNDFNILKTYVGGQCVFDGEDVLFEVGDVEFKNTFDVSVKDEADFDIHYDGKSVKVNVIGCVDGDLLTSKTIETLDVENSIVQPDLDNDVIKISVVERYGGNTQANAFIKGFNLKKGAIASSVAHDSHNIVAVGTNSKDMAGAVNQVIENNGGIAIACGEFKNSLPLPIAGLMTNEDGYSVAFKLKELQDECRSFGSRLNAPFMTMAFMALLVIPSLKISNQGLFDGDSFDFIDVIIE